MTLKTVTLGCKVNQYETEFVREGLLRHRLSTTRPRTSRPTCASSTPARSRPKGTPRAGRRFAGWRRENPAAQIVVMGCYATRAPEEVAALPNVTEVRDRQARDCPICSGRFGVHRRADRHLAVRPPASGLREGAGRLPAAVQLLHHSPRAAATCTAGRSSTFVDEVRAAGRQRLPRDRAHRHSPGALRRRVELATRRRTSGCGCRTLVRELGRAAGRFPRAALEHRGDRSHARADRRDGRASRTRSPRICTSPCKAAATPCCAGCGAAGAASGSSIAADWCARRSTPGDHDRHHRRLPRRDGRRVRRDAAASPASAASRRSTSFRSAPAAARPPRRWPTRSPRRSRPNAASGSPSSKPNCERHTFSSLIGRRLTVLIEGQGEVAPGRYAGTSCRYAPVEVRGQDLRPASLVRVQSERISSCGTRLEASLMHRA